jgi:hypothetical protein
MLLNPEHSSTQADTVEVVCNGGLWYWQRYTADETPVGPSRGPFGTELAARRNARHVNPDAVVMLPPSR